MTSEYRVSIGGEDWTLEPPHGLTAMRMMPKVLSFLSKIVEDAVKSGFPIDSMLSGDLGSTLDAIGLIRAIGYISSALGDNYDEFADVIVPYLLQKDKKWLQEHGTPREIILGIWVALRMIFEAVSDSEVKEALKNSEAAAVAEPVMHGKDQ